MEHPPQLAGDVALDVKREDPDHVRLTLSSDGHNATLRATALLVPYPSGLRRLLAEEVGLDAVIVDRIPRGLGGAAQEHGVSYLDRSGNGRVVAPGFVYVSEPSGGSGRPVQRRSSPFAPAASRVVRALLVDPVHRWRVSEIASVVDFNPGNVHRTLAALVDIGLVERDDDAYVVPDPGSLLEAWADQAMRPREQYTLPIERSPLEDVKRLAAELRTPAVVSGELGAELLAPYLSSESAVIHLHDEDAFHALAGSALGTSLPSVARHGRILFDLTDPGNGSVRRSCPRPAYCSSGTDLRRPLPRARARKRSRRTSPSRADPILNIDFPIRGPTDELLLEGLRDLRPVLNELSQGVVVIGGLATAAWLYARPVDLPTRLTPDVDLGINKRVLGLTSRESKLKPLLEAAGFKSGYADEEFRFWKEVGSSQETFVVDLLVPSGASRENPPVLERDLRSLAAPGLAYAIDRGPVEMEIRFPTEAFRLPVITLDAAFVMKAALVDSGLRLRPDRRRTDTVDAAMLAAACLTEPKSLAALRQHRRRSDVKKASRFLAKLARPTSAEARRVEDHFADLGLRQGAEWAATVALKMIDALGTEVSAQRKSQAGGRDGPNAKRRSARG